MDPSAMRLLPLIGYAIGSLVGVGLLIATVIVLAKLRRHRPASSGLLFGWAIAALVWGLARSGLGYATVFLFDHLGGGFERLQAIQLAVSVFGSLVSFALGVSFLVGLARVMRDPDFAP